MILWKNGQFHTMENELSTHHQMVTDQGLIIGFEDVSSEIDFDQIIDLRGAHVYPGFVDAHLHLLGYGQKLSRPNISHLKGRTEILSFIRQAFHQESLFIEGYSECGITKSDLDLISFNDPIYLRHADYHSLTVNSKALSISNEESINGVLTEKEALHVVRAFLVHTNEKLEKLLKNAIESLYEYGITGGHSDDLYYFNGFRDTFNVFEKVLSQYPFRTNLLIHHLVLSDYIKSKKPFLDQNNHLQLGAVKMFYDGTISSKTALLKSPYLHSDNYGLKVQLDEEFIGWVKMVRKHNLPLAIHVIGDQGLTNVIEILKKHPPKEGLHDRLIHTPYMNQDSINQLKKMPVSLDIQPQFLSSDLPWALDSMSKQPELIFPWKSLLDAGINLAGSSDAPVEIPNPLLGIHAAVERISNHDHKVYDATEKLSRFEAISLYTKGANFSTMKINRGMLKPGFIADLTIFNHDLLKMPASHFLVEKCVMTVVDEKVVYKR